MIKHRPGGLQKSNIHLSIRELADILWSCNSSPMHVTTLTCTLHSRARTHTDLHTALPCTYSHWLSHCTPVHIPILTCDHTHTFKIKSLNYHFGLCTFLMVAPHGCPKIVLFYLLFYFSYSNKTNTEEWVLVRLLLLQWNTMTKKQVGEERVYLAYTSTLLFITEGSQDRHSNRVGSWRQERMQRPWRGAAYWLAPHGLLSPPSYRIQDHLARECTTHHELGLLPLITNWENALQPHLMVVFSQLRLPPLRWL